MTQIGTATKLSSHEFYYIKFTHLLYHTFKDIGTINVPITPEALYTESV